VYETLLRPALFRLSDDDPERAHAWAMRALAWAARSRVALAALRRVHAVADPRLRQTVFGAAFPNPVGLAAGFDKDAVALPALAALGFGFIEAGTVTLHPQPGNPRPRIVRLPEHAALINRLGFNNDGAAAVAARLARLDPLTVPLGISLGKSKVTPLDGAVDDYLGSLRLLERFADYIAVNVSSPNTPGLRALQEREAIAALLGALRAATAKPLLVKVAPDLSDAALDDLLDVALAHRIDGLIAVNTTLAREPVAGHPRAGETGGLSGRPLRERARAVVRRVVQTTGGRLPVIGVGGISTDADAYAMIRAGASLVQVYTSFVYGGPAVAGRINRGLLRRMERDGVRSLADLRGDGAETAGIVPDRARPDPGEATTPDRRDQHG
jgi:dihydroorotate dehydrogenase